MVKTCSAGNEVIFAASSYGHASREESKRWWHKCKAMQDIGNGVAIPMMTVDKSSCPAGGIFGNSTPGGVSRLIVATSPARTTPRGLFGHYNYTIGGGNQGVLTLVLHTTHVICGWDSLPPDARKKMSGLSKRYSCTTKP
jgi:hypothetical protein